MRVHIAEFKEQYTIGCGCIRRWATVLRKNLNGRRKCQLLRAQAWCFLGADAGCVRGSQKFGPVNKAAIHSGKVKSAGGEAKRGDAVGRARWRSSFLGAPGVEFFCGRSRSLDRSMRSTSGAPKFLGTGATSPSSQDAPYLGETERKFKLLQVCPRNPSH